MYLTAYLKIFFFDFKFYFKSLRKHKGGMNNIEILAFVIYQINLAVQHNRYLIDTSTKD